MVFQYLKRSASSNPYIFVSFVIAAIGPALVVGVPSIRKSMGHVKAVRAPESYPLPKRARNPPAGYED
ncbi:hypothetical protein EDD11_004094 [Mortierella claussenii]|nr:hypothetical protein EDD11_004094 [Mortierella claussenii]